MNGKGEKGNPKSPSPLINILSISVLSIGVKPYVSSFTLVPSSSLLRCSGRSAIDRQAGGRFSACTRDGDELMERRCETKVLDVFQNEMTTAWLPACVGKKSGVRRELSD